jgi:heme/copper-type cytochrome/quinol oxidase subunit 2
MFIIMLSIGLILLLVWFLLNKVLIAYLAKREDLSESQKKFYGRMLIIIIFFPYVAYIEYLLKH